METADFYFDDVSVDLYHFRLEHTVLAYWGAAPFLHAGDCTCVT
jgi:hypothetical protein